MITTENEEYANAIRIYGMHGMSKDAWNRYSDQGYKHYRVIYPGFKYNMTDIQASFGIHQLNRIESNYRRRREIWDQYNKAFKDLPVTVPAPVDENSRHALHLYTLLLNLEAITIDRDTVMKAIAMENIGSGVHFISLHLHQYYMETFKYKLGDFLNSEFISERTLSMPLSSKLSNRDVEDVIEAVSKVLTYYKK
jgi:dTDP-4-amino-4,6-dideoxygalactose transaminase